MGFWGMLLITGVTLWAFVCVFIIGYLSGVKEADRRWSDYIASCDRERDLTSAFREDSK